MVSMGGMNKVELDNGEVQTDADGNFSVRVVLTAPKQPEGICWSTVIMYMKYRQR